MAPPALDKTPGSLYSFASRISAMEVQTADGQGEYHTVWAGRGLDGDPVVSPSWAPAPTTAIKLIIERQAYTQGPSDTAMIEEVEFPGDEAAAPPLARSLAELTLQELRPTEGAIRRRPGPHPANRLGRERRTARHPHQHGPARRPTARQIAMRRG